MRVDYIILLLNFGFFKNDRQQILDFIYCKTSNRARNQTRKSQFLPKTKKSCDITWQNLFLCDSAYIFQFTRLVQKRVESGAGGDWWECWEVRKIEQVAASPSSPSQVCFIISFSTGQVTKTKSDEINCKTQFISYRSTSLGWMGGFLGRDR